MRFLVIFLLSINAYAECPELYPYSNPIKVAYELCNLMYVSQYDDNQSKVIFTSELLQPRGHNVKRVDTFRKDYRTNTPSVSSYKNTGYDRGHMVPADDATNQYEMFETFLLSNIAPQVPNLNRGRWKELEEYIRYVAYKEGKPIHVVTGAVYNDNKKINNIPVPSAFYKIVYFKSGTKAYYTKNTFDDILQNVDVNWINNVSNINFPR